MTRELGELAEWLRSGLQIRPGTSTTPEKKTAAQGVNLDGGNSVSCDNETDNPSNLEEQKD